MTNKYKSIATLLRLAVLISTFFIVGQAANFLRENLERTRVETQLRELRERNINVYLTKLGYYE